MSRPDAIIVGGGVIGSAVACSLARDGLSVQVIESEFPASGATAAGMGHVVVMDDSPAQMALTSYSRRLLNELDLPGECELDVCGTLWLAADGEELQALRTKQQYYTSHGVRAELLDEQAVAEAEPELRSGVAGALRIPDDAVLYPVTFARWLLAASGASVRRARVTALNDRAAQIGSEVLHADIVVNAAGALAPALTAALPIVPRRGHLVITDRHPRFCRHQLVETGYLRSAHTMGDASVAFNVQPRVTGQLLIGSSRELVGWDAHPNRAIVQRMLQRAAEWMPRIRTLSAIRSWTGFRPATPDKLPLIGPWPEQHGAWIAAGHEGLGITTALATGAILADLIAGRTPQIEATPFAPARALTGLVA